MPATMQRFGVELKTTPDASANNPQDKVDRSKASVYSWDDEKLQQTAVVQKRITKSATTVQRFIRACISHWQYYNEERLPLLEELKDVERRRLEELEEVEHFRLRSLEQARIEFEAELAMPKEEFEARQKLSKELKQEIKDEEEAMHQLSKDIVEERDRAKKLGREEHEIKAQHTLSRLDVEVPALEAEKAELEGVRDEFSQVVKGLQSQYDAMNVNVGLEERHKKRLMKCMAKMVKKLEAGGAKPKIINAVKLCIMYKGEEPPPKPASAPAPPNEATEESVAPTSTEEPSPTTAENLPDEEENKDTLADDLEVVEGPTPAEIEPEQNNNTPEAEGPVAVANDEPNEPKGEEPQEMEGRDLRMAESTRSEYSELLEEESDDNSISVENAPAEKREGRSKAKSSKKKSKSPEKKSDSDFDWGDQERVAAEMSKSRSLSPTKKKKSATPRKEKPNRAKSADHCGVTKHPGDKKSKKSKGTTTELDGNASFNWSEMLEDESKKGKKSSKKNGPDASFDWSGTIEDDKKGKQSSKSKLSEASFNWSSKLDEDKKVKKTEKSEKKKSSSSSPERRGRGKSRSQSPVRKRRGSKTTLEGAHFSWVDHAKEPMDKN